MGKIKKDEKGQWSIAIGATSYKCTDLWKKYFSEI